MRKPTDTSTALAAFIARKTEIDTILARLTALSAEHFNTTPDEVTWAHAGTLGGAHPHSTVLRASRDPLARCVLWR